MEVLTGPYHAILVVLAVGGAAKLWRPAPFETAVRQLGVSVPAGTGRVAGVGEVLLAGVALVLGGWIPAAVVAAAYLGFSVVVVVSMRRGVGSCGCFGQPSTPPSWLHVAVNVCSAAVALAVVLWPVLPAVDVLGDQPGLGLPYLFAVAVAGWLTVAIDTGLADLVGVTRAATISRSDNSLGKRMSTRLVDRAANALADRFDRRGFLGRTAVVGSALAVAPVDYALRPKSAYAAVCNCSGQPCTCGSLCCDGWTEFCCTLNGVNTCPEGTVAAGWWKVDGSQFCGGGPRYYLDCNALCGDCGCGGNGVCSGTCSGTNCGCAHGDCNNRKSGCTRFRYGQCHQEMPCVGPIVCRVVTCVAPWVFDPTCSTASRTSEATRYHHRPCLEEEPFGVVDLAADAGGVIRVRGWAIDRAPGGVEPTHVQVFVDGQHAGTQLADQSRPDVGEAYPAFGPDHGFDMEVHASVGPHLVCVNAVDTDTWKSSWIGFAVADVLPPQGNIDGVVNLGDGKIRVGGWARDQSRGVVPATIRITVNGEVKVHDRAEDPRPDVEANVEGAGPNHGFSFDIDVGTGPHVVCLEVVHTSHVVAEVGCTQIEVV